MFEEMCEERRERERWGYIIREYIMFEEMCEERRERERWGYIIREYIMFEERCEERRTLTQINVENIIARINKAHTGTRTGTQRGTQRVYDT